MRRWLVVVMATLLWGCPEEPGDARVEVCASAGPEVWSLAEGDEVELVLGPQGGWHLDVGTMGFGVEAEGARLRYEVWAADTREAFHMDVVYSLRAARVRDEGAFWVRAGDRAFLNVASAEAIAGRTVALSVVLELPDGRLLDDARAVRVVDRE